ncbi:MAG: hypothetical protein CVU39_02655 [Chloroflexi bacterium HGW-Chloroflexi-10]|nr:MAG: hypothetical protein CVU39_02655 [Chloroflexi bacterium HGW-Chloroflexi-10]
MDGIILNGETKFTKTWRLKNSGQTNWTTEYALVFVSDNAVDSKAVIELPTIVKPGDVIDLSVEFTTPSKDGEYTSYWVLRNKDGKSFGLGDKSDRSFWVMINIANYTADIVPSENTPWILQQKFVKQIGRVITTK